MAIYLIDLAIPGNNAVSGLACSNSELT